MTLSFSRLSAFMLCPAYFACKHLLGFPEPESPEIYYGKVVHALLAEQFGGPACVSEEDRKRLEQVAPEILDRAQNAVARVKAFWPESDVVAVEHDFEFLLPSTNLILRGRFDMLERRPSGITVVDWKTVGPSRYAVEAAAARHAISLQGTIYYLAARQHFPEGVNPRVHFVSINDTEIRDEVVEISDARVQRDINTIIYYAESLQQLLQVPPELWPLNTTACVQGTRLCPYYDLHKEPLNATEEIG
jgi:hypothetical protein